MSLPDRHFATEHSDSRTLQSNDVLPERRIAWDGTAYTYTEFVNWYGTHARPLWEGAAAATEHSESSTIATHALPALEPQAAVGTERGRDATEHSISRMILQCRDCARRLCGTEDLAFFWRANSQGGVEVHLMLKPENKEPATFIRSPVMEKGATASWQCACGFKFGDTRPVGVNKASMTAFKSSSVMLCGQRFTGRKSKWPSIYDQPPFDAIEVRTRDTFFGSTGDS